MGDKSKISWTDATWNPLVGCTRVSEGCRNCYAERVAATRMKDVPAYDGIARVNADGEPRWTGTVRLLEDRLDQPLRWRRPRMVFVNSMSDLFHESVPDEHIDWVFAVMAEADQHIFQVLTKRPERMLRYMQGRDWGDAANRVVDRFIRPLEQALYLGGEMVPPLPNVWLGVSVEDQATANERIPLLLETPAAVRWVSLEPLLGPVDLTRVGSGMLGSSYSGITLDALIGGRKTDTPWHLNWVVVGGESGPGARPMHPEWVRSLRNQCQAAGVPFHFKQWGEWVPETQNGAALSERTAETALYVAPDGSTRPARWGARGDSATVQRVGKRAAGRQVDYREWDEYPAVLLEGVGA